MWERENERKIHTVICKVCMHFCGYCMGRTIKCMLNITSIKYEFVINNIMKNYFLSENKIKKFSGREGINKIKINQLHEMEKKGKFNLIYPLYRKSYQMDVNNLEGTKKKKLFFPDSLLFSTHRHYEIYI